MSSRATLRLLPARLIRALLASGLVAGLAPGLALARPRTISVQGEDAIRQPPDGLPEPASENLREFLTWAHPVERGCRPPEQIEILDRWTGGLRVRFRVICARTEPIPRAEPIPRTDTLEAVLETREGPGVWQVAGGFEAGIEQVEGALRSAGLLEPGSPGSPPGLSPPRDPSIPADAVGPTRILARPRSIRETAPQYPEEAGRARLIGQAHVELLVDVPVSGEPQRARPLRGPDPDLGMRRAAVESVLKWRFLPATVSGLPVRAFLPVDVRFEGLPPESREWAHRALFQFDAIVSPNREAIEAARRSLDSGEPFKEVEASFLGGGPRAEGTRAEGAGVDGVRTGDWGMVAATGLPPALRKELHETRIGGYAGPVEADGVSYLVRKRGEIYYAIRSVEGDEVSYQILHQRNAPQGDAMKRLIESDVADFLAERRRRNYGNAAARLMGIRQTFMEIGRLEIRTDALSQEEVRMLGRVVEATVGAHEQLWAPIVPLRPFKDRVLVYAFARDADHEALHRLWGSRRAPAKDEPGTDPAGSAAAPAAWVPAGEYIPASRILAIPCQAMEGHLPVPIAIHEAVHMLEYERVYAPGVQPSKWFEEGLATYLGFSQVDSQLRIQPGNIHRSGTIVTEEIRVQFDPRAQLRDYLRRCREEGPVPLQKLLSSGAGAPFWVGEDSPRAYGASWTLVHYLRHGEKGRLRPEFQTYAALEARGEGGPGAFARLFGPDQAAFEAAWHAYEAGL